MHRDQLLGILIALLIHAGFAFGHYLIPGGSGRKSADAEDVPTIAITPMPILAPEPPDPSEADALAEAEPADLSDLAPPPMQADTPAVVAPSAFQQKLQPPPPPNLGGPAGAITIPKGNFGAAAGTGLKGLFDLAALDQKPVPRFIAKPTYPYEMRRARVNGEVVIGLIVDAEGNVINPYIISSTNPAFEAEALRAILRWKFRPGKKSGVSVSTRNVQVPLVFNLATGA
ncbi:TonB family protein [Termitidicoccus mucosus]|uniref:Energy transducer TonB n=1 Tax=Termitidicoccus mucosus TaxID=1184151 RepID=A0A178IQ65_9BACT|nr:energy transducer TonB [Opitutaceae bacterium TSB47]